MDRIENNATDYEVVVGLEVHAQLMTNTKLFSGDPVAFGAEPNTQVSPITLAHPGTLPMLNQKAVELAVRLGLACRSTITRTNYFARKNYFYPDLPKGYQISQHTLPVCSGGEISIQLKGLKHAVQLNRIHLEEDAGKSIHDNEPGRTCVDYNRAGIALVEIVTEPCIHSAEEAGSYLTELRKLLRYLDVCDGNMEEGSMRCDANISIRPAGSKKLGTRVEVKNLNSIRNVKKAIEVETTRMTDLVRSGKIILQQTRSFDAETQSTFALRTKEEANDYRYFADPDLAPFNISDDFLKSVRENMPELPEERVNRYIRSLQLTEYDARVISDEKEFAGYFDRLIQHTNNHKAAVNWMNGPVRSWLNETQQNISEFPIQPVKLAAVIALVEKGTISFSVAASRLFQELVRAPASDPSQLAITLNLVQDADEVSIHAWVEEVLNNMPEKVLEFKKGKKGLIGLFVGEVKRVSRGKADPKLTTDILLQKLQQ